MNIMAASHMMGMWVVVSKRPQNEILVSACFNLLFNNLMQDSMEPLLYCHPAKVAASIRACNMEFPDLVPSRPHSRTAAHPGFPQGTLDDSRENKEIPI